MAAVSLGPEHARACRWLTQNRSSRATSTFHQKQLPNRDVPTQLPQDARLDGRHLRRPELDQRDARTGRRGFVAGVLLRGHGGYVVGGGESGRPDPEFDA